MSRLKNGSDKYVQSEIHMYMSTHTYCHGATLPSKVALLDDTTDGLSVFCPTEFSVGVTQS